MREVTESGILFEGIARVSAAPIGDTGDSRGDRRSGDDVPPSANRIVLLLIVILALVNVTSTVLMLRSWSNDRFLANDVTEMLLGDPSPKEQN
jgi:hypothetical protein